MLREQTFTVRGVTISFVEGPPSGPPLVLLHGGGDRWQDFLPLIPSLLPRWHVFALDLRGHGKSGRVPGQYRPEQYVPDIKAFLERQITERAVLFGHSLGGWIALMVAADMQERVQALILADPPLSIETFIAQQGTEESIKFYCALRGIAGSKLPVPELAAALSDMPVFVPGQKAPVRYGDLPGRDTVHLRRRARTLRQVDPDAVQYHAEGRIKEYVQNVDPDAALRRLTCPVLLLQAEAVSDSDAKHALSLLANGAHVKLEGIGHDLGLYTWKVSPLLRAVTDFLESL
ncbi:MAG: alpha/beta fold hydrolase [Dehalococcoidia bacterium]